jgi:hypothetical protein
VEAKARHQRHIELDWPGSPRARRTRWRRCLRTPPAVQSQRSSGSYGTTSTILRVAGSTRTGVSSTTVYW